MSDRHTRLDKSSELDENNFVAVATVEAFLVVILLRLF